MTSDEVRTLIEVTGDGPTKRALGLLAKHLRLDEERAAELEEFTSAVKTPESWLNQSAKLLLAAQLIERLLAPLQAADPIALMQGREADRSVEEKALYSLQILSVAFALENAFKAVLSAKKQLNVESNGKLKGPWTDGHDIVNLAEKAGYAMESAGERAWLRSLSHFGTWIGRYPVPMTAALLARCLKPEEISSDHPDLVEYSELLIRWCAGEIERHRLESIANTP